MVYLPFGEVSQPNSWGNDSVTSKFTGQEYDAETGLYNYGARYYDPAIGRFVSADTIVPNVTDAQAFNRYAYARDNPIIYTDPTGHSFFSFVSSIFHAIAGAISSALRGLWHAVTWLANRYVDAVKLWIRGQVFAFQIAKSMVIAASQNPMAALGLILAIAAGPPGWAALAVSIAAQGMAMAAGVRDPQTLAIIGALAGAAAGGVTAVLMSGAKLGVERALTAAGQPELATLSSLALSMIPNGETVDPEVSPGNAIDASTSSAPSAGSVQSPSTDSPVTPAGPEKWPEALADGYTSGATKAATVNCVDYYCKQGYAETDWGNTMRICAKILEPLQDVPFGRWDQMALNCSQACAKINKSPEFEANCLPPKKFDVEGP